MTSNNLQMNSKKQNDFHNSLNFLNQKIEVFSKKRKELFMYLEEYINNFQVIKFELNKLLSTAKEIHDIKLNNYNKKIKELKNNKIEFKKLISNLNEEKKRIQKPRDNIKGSEQIDSLYKKIKQINLKIINLEKIIHTKNLEINEENDVVEKISELEKNKLNLTEKITIIEQKQIKVHQNSKYFQTQRRIEIFEIKLKKIYDNLIKWSDKKQKNNKKMVDLYQKVNELKSNKKKMEKELLENKERANMYALNFLNSLNQEKKNSIDKKHKHNRTKNKNVQGPKLNLIIHNKKNSKILKREKLAIALEKRKAGKKLDINEYRLILEQSRK